MALMKRLRRTMNFDYHPHLRNLLNRKQLEFVNNTIQTSLSSSFSGYFQDRHTSKEGGQYYSVRTILTAVENSESTFAQYPLDERNLKELARSIFVEHHWLMNDPLLAESEGLLYIVGGRHRVHAVLGVFAQLADRFGGSNEEDRQEYFNDLLDQEVRVSVIHLRERTKLVELIITDNRSRTVRGAEASHLEAQRLGANATAPESAVEAALTTPELEPKMARSLAAQAFTRREHPKLKPQTRQVLGEKVAQFILYGVRKGDRLRKDSPLHITSVEQYNDLMSEAWNILVEDIEGQVVVAKNATDIAEGVIDKLIPRTDVSTEAEASQNISTDTEGDVGQVFEFEKPPRKPGRPRKKTQEMTGITF